MVCQRIPIFPLHSVLLPGAPLVLDVFESRYLEMVEHCLEREAGFGVALIRSGREAHGPLATPWSLGCTAAIERAERLPDGRFGLLAVGGRPFEIVRLHRERPYLEADVRHLDMAASPDRASLAGTREELELLIEAYLSLLRRSVAGLDVPPELPADPVRLAWAAASILDAAPETKLRLLQAADDAALLRSVVALYRRELPVLRAESEERPLVPGSPFSRN